MFRLVSHPGQVVVNLIMDMHRLGHESYADINEEEVRQRAAELPENGVPPEVLKVIEEVDDSHDKLQPQKAATPCDGRDDPSTAGKTFAEQRARAVVAEGVSLEDAHNTSLAALHELQTKLTPKVPATEAPMPLEVRTGNQFVDQFQPWYFAVAFPFCFKYGTACPDVKNMGKAQSNSGEDISRRRHGNPQAPDVKIQAWAAGMARRAESQFQRDWTFGFTLWNYLFRTKVNLQQNTSIYSAPVAESGKKQDEINKAIADGARELLSHIRNGEYLDISGAKKPVKGDLTKLRHVPGLSVEAKKLLGDLEARSKYIPGTHEVRKTMRHQTHANRVCYGTSIFLTFSPSERDTTLMVRLARARQSDPAIIADGSGRYQQRSQPQLDLDFMRLSPEALAEDCAELD